MRNNTKSKNNINQFNPGYIDFEWHTAISKDVVERKANIP